MMGSGIPTSAFLICTFWLIEALARCGKIDEARAAMTQALGAMSPLGLLSEDYDPITKRLWGNYPQAYSHVGLIHAAFAASPGWTDIVTAEGGVMLKHRCSHYCRPRWCGRHWPQMSH